MSASETLVAAGDDPDPVRALRSALFAVGRQLAERGATPGHLEAMTWTAPDPGALHPSRRAVDLAYREAFGGTRPPVTIEAGPAVRVSAGMRTPSPLDPALANTIRGYTPRLQVADLAGLFDAWNARGAAFRTHHAALDLAYGPSAAETLDLYRPQGVARPPVWVFVHGGYWQAMNAVQHARFASGMLQAGFAVANIEYGLAPQVTVETIVAQVRRAVRFLAREADALGIDAGRIHVAGHSAGGHLAAMAALDASGPPIRSALLLSGLFDLRALSHLPIGRLLGLDHASYAEGLSPALVPAPAGTRIAVAVGGAESEAFVAQSCDIAARWNAPSPLVVPGANHFDLLEGLLAGDLLDLAKATARD